MLLVWLILSAGCNRRDGGAASKASILHLFVILYLFWRC